MKILAGDPGDVRLTVGVRGTDESGGRDAMVHLRRRGCLELVEVVDTGAVSLQCLPECLHEGGVPASVDTGRVPGGTDGTEPRGITAMCKVVGNGEGLGFADFLNDAELVVDGSLGAAESIFERAVGYVPSGPRVVVGVTRTVRQRQEFPTCIGEFDDLTEESAVVDHPPGSLAAPDRTGKAGGVCRRCSGRFGLGVEVGTDPSAQTLITCRFRAEASHSSAEDGEPTDAAEFDGNPAGAFLQCVFVGLLEDGVAGLPDYDRQFDIGHLGHLDIGHLDIDIAQCGLDGGHGRA